VNQYTSRCTTWPSGIYVRVYSTSRTCGTYRLTVTR